MPDKLIQIKLDKHISNFCKLSDVLDDFICGSPCHDPCANELLQKAVDDSIKCNGFFTRETVCFCLRSLIFMLEEGKFKKWVGNYPEPGDAKITAKKIGVVMAGNIPLVGFHDFLCVLVSGNIFVGKLSKNDRFLLPAIAEILFRIDPIYKNYIYFTEEKLSDFDAVIATGSNNTSRYFDYYFEKYPHIIRSNRNSIAVLNGDETREQLTFLADDVFTYFGLGCRNVSKIFVPEKYPFQKFIDAMQRYLYINDHNKFRNNYDYYRTIFTMNNQKFIDGGFFILNPDPSVNSPVAVINYERYADTEQVNSFIRENENKIQCVVSEMDGISKSICFGKAQQPELWDYADNIDTLNFLLKIKYSLIV
ncbi:MAG TPA: acyl-CoA reductase [Bacteroidales bacterium]|nr:acyl-CoA reductase [Bacteroidales bacterium]